MPYVYAYLTGDNEPFYIGAGTGSRDVSHFRLCQTAYANLPFFYAKLHKMLSLGQELKVIRLLDDLTHYEAFEVWEPFFIKAIGRRDLGLGPLCNLTDGGDGHHNPSAEWRLAKSREMQNRFVNIDERVAQSVRTKAYFQDEINRRRVSEQMKVIGNTPERRKENQS